MQRELLIKGGWIVTPFEVIENGVVVVRNGRIAFVGKENRATHSANASVLDASDKIVSPGFIDTQIVGARGFDASAGSLEAVREVARFCSETGTTSLLVAVGTRPFKKLVQGLRGVREAIRKGTDTAEVLGIHLEGPYISPIKKGAHNPNYIRPPSISELNVILRESANNVILATVAPEVQGAISFIRELKRRGVTVSIGHSNATYEETLTGIRAGMSHATHVFNGMREFHHREPGVLGAVLTCDNMTASLIADGIHVHPAAMKVLVKAKGTDKIVLITDSVVAGLQNGTYKLVGLDVVLSDGVCKLKSGLSLAGSSLAMNKAVRNMIELVGVPIRDAVGMATINPAKVIGTDRRKGSIEIGKDADIIVIDERINVYATLVKGKAVYNVLDKN